jgi:hypothetical protein
MPRKTKNNRKISFKKKNENSLFKKIAKKQKNMKKHFKKIKQKQKSHELCFF